MPEVAADRHQLLFVHVVDPLAVDEDAAAVRLQQSERQPEDRGLPCAARAQEDLGVPGLQREAHLTQDHLLVERQIDVVEDDDRAAEGEGLVQQRGTALHARSSHVNTSAR